MSRAMEPAAGTVETRRPRLGFLGAGNRGLAAIAASGAGEIAAIGEPAAAGPRALDGVAPRARHFPSLDELLREPLDGLVIDSSGGQHADEAKAALERGLAVFCQLPPGRTAAETRGVIEAARAADRLLGVDHRYRHTEAMRVLRSVVQAGELGDVYAVDVVFHHAYGPELPGDGDPERAAGCVSDLGAHVVDLALWTLGFPRVTRVTSRRYARGELLQPGRTSVAEDYAAALIELDTGATVRLGCSWNLAAGTDAIIEASFYGTEGGGTFRNVNGSFHDFTAELLRGTSRHTLAAPPDDWSGRAVVEWASRVARGDRYDPWIEGVIDVAAALDGVLGR